MTASEPLVSVVTPVYNEQQHLAECIESVLSQTHRNWNYTIVDNCSTDSSLAIAQRYATADRRIRVVRNSHFLTSLQNCNAALRHVTEASSYCKVVLGDDWIYPECLERMVAVAEANPAVGIVSAYALEGERVTLTGLPYRTTVVSGLDACRQHLLARRYVFGTQTSVLYRAGLVRRRDPFFNESNAHADTEACFEICREADFGFVHQVLTFTRIRPQSLYARALAIETPIAFRLRLLVKYGPACLTPDELTSALNEHVKQYYRFLGKSLLVRRDREFWDFHRTSLMESGLGYSRARVAHGMLLTVADALLRPKDVVKKLTEDLSAHSGGAARATALSQGRENTEATQVD